MFGTQAAVFPFQSASETAPAPVRGPSVKVESGDQDGGGEEGGAAAAAAPVSLADLMPKVDISGQIKEELITELGDKNWKIRNEALQKVGSCWRSGGVGSSWRRGGLLLEKGYDGLLLEKGWGGLLLEKGYDGLLLVGGWAMATLDTIVTP